MATQLIGTGGQTVQLKLTKFDKRLISRLRAETNFNKFGRMASVGRNQGKAISFRRMESIYAAGLANSAAAGSAPTALTEGTFPAAIDATWTELQATLSQYGQVLLYSDLIDTQALDDWTGEATENLSETMKDALDLLTRDILVAGTNRQYASIALTRGGASGVGSGMRLNLAELRESKRTLKRNNVKPVRGQDGKYVVLCHPDSMFDLESDSNITNIFQYSTSSKHNDELFEPSYRDLPLGFRIFESTNCRIFAAAGLSSADVYQTHVLGDEAYGVVDYEALPARIIRKPRGSGGATGDPLDQVASIGWKSAHTAVILDQARHVVIEHSAAAGAMG
jgi:N4-gp56 family major capsid protein